MVACADILSLFQLENALETLAVDLKLDRFLVVRLDAATAEVNSGIASCVSEKPGSPSSRSASCWARTSPERRRPSNT